MKVVAIIPARGGSKRLLRKKIAPIFNRPMMFWALQACWGSAYKIEPWVSTEDEEIVKVAAGYRAKVHHRSPDLATDDVYKQAVIRSAARDILESEEGEPDIWVSLQPNSPEIKSHHLDEAIDTLLEAKRDEIFSVDFDLMQNAAFRVFRGDYVFQKDLSTNCGAYICDIKDVHTQEDIDSIEQSRYSKL